MNNPDVLMANLNDLEKHMTPKQPCITDFVVKILGSWNFIIAQTILLVIWGILNIFAVVEHWDPYPFILLNLILSLQTAYAAPIIMMSQNKQAARDRLEAHNDFLINMKSEEGIRIILERLEIQNNMILNIHSLLESEKTERPWENSVSLTQ